MIDLLPIGKLGKSQGVNGHIRLNLSRNVKLQGVRTIFVNVKGDKIPYFIENVDNDSVKFDEIHNPEDAKYLTGYEIFLNREDFEETIDESDELSTFVGYTIFDIDKKIAVIEDVVEYPQQIMAVINYEEQTILIPLVEEFIIDINPETKELKLELPEGFIDAQII